MDDRTHHPAQAPGAGARAGVLGAALAGVLAFALASGSWQWFSTYIGATLLAILLSSTRPPTRAAGTAAGHARGLAAYALVVGLCVALALAPAMQRWSWLFPMPGTRRACTHLGDYARLRAQAGLADLAGHDGAALAAAQDDQARRAVAECLSATTTLWLPVYALGAALLTALAVHLLDRRP
ncbi:hypothetical protein [Streptomyces sp. FH025]|uniref:hypothetical protein n=1 Tax=Streptomyces sp. FH025 TaxID=2815937 RepID=UPI001A9EDA9D|nr:hypothetical protein [Streptomyces sp. FH025]MBO1418034.1 hypothetical protein [Streptomyces sp. FH025]